MKEKYFSPDKRRDRGPGVEGLYTYGYFSVKVNYASQLYLSHLRKRVLKLVFLSQPPYKFVNLFFTLRIS
jgi:hypothetical protein